MGYNSCPRIGDDPPTSPDREGERAWLNEHIALCACGKPDHDSHRKRREGFLAGHAAGVERERAAWAANYEEALKGIGAENADLRARLAEAEKDHQRSLQVMAEHMTPCAERVARLAAAERDREAALRRVEKLEGVLEDAVDSLEYVQRNGSATGGAVRAERTEKARVLLAERAK